MCSCLIPQLNRILANLFRHFVPSYNFFSKLVILFSRGHICQVHNYHGMFKNEVQFKGHTSDAGFLLEKM